MITMKRIETDLLGEIEVPAHALYGAQTQRAIENFPVQTQKHIGDFPLFITALLTLKKTAAIVNQQIGVLTPQQGIAICAAIDKILQDKLFSEFPIHYLHGGGGTSANMNANEVIANVAEEILSGHRGEYRFIHPNDHVNRHQSTNDIIPSACHIAVIQQWADLKDEIEALCNSFDHRIQTLKDSPRIARTCLQDAVEITFADFLSGQRAAIQRSLTRVDQDVFKLHILNLGGSIIGRTKDVPSSYFSALIPILRSLLKDSSYNQSSNFFDATQNLDDLVAVADDLALIARVLIKIAQDFRLLSSGPEAGLHEIILPPVQPGSTIMPGKINPVIPEFLIQCCFQVIGYAHTCQMALDHGELDLNVWESSVIFNILSAMELLIPALRMFREKCIVVFSVDQERNATYIHTIIPLLTHLMQIHGYSRISEICKQAHGDMVKLRQLLREHGYDTDL